MSDTLYPYAVPAAKLVAVSGSRDRKLVTWIRQNYSLAGWVDDMIRE